MTGLIPNGLPSNGPERCPGVPVIAGDPIEFIARTYGYTTQELVAFWCRAYSDAIDGWTHAEAK